MSIFQKIKHFFFPAIVINYQNSETYYPALNGVRGIAILLVILFHTFHFMFGWCGVDLFFVLSGFLITGSLLETKNQEHYFKNFWIKRVLRIFPLYYLILLLILVPKDLFNIETISYTSPSYWFYMQNWKFVKDGVFTGGKDTLNHFWSLAIEEQFYFFFPFIIRFTKPKMLVNLLLAFIIVAIGFRYYFFSFNNIGYYVATVSRLDSLSLGALTAYLIRHQREILEKWVHPVFYAALIYIAIVILHTKEMHFSNPYFATFGLTVFALLFVCIVIYSLSLSKNNYLTKILNHRTLIFIGKIAYGLYVFHWILYVFIKPSLEKTIFDIIHQSIPSKIITSTCIFCIALLTSYLSYHFFEKKFLRLKSKLTT